LSDSQLPQFFWDEEVTPTGRSGPDWIWHGLLARRTTTLLTVHGKLTGKTTLPSMLLAEPRRPNPNKATLWRWLESAWAQGQLDRECTGTT
jgi:hypothetical protein